jgi:hypothetical protein
MAKKTSNIFKSLELEALKAGITPRTKESQAWFRKQASKLGSINKTKLLNDKRLTKESDTVVGTMQMFFYNPKHKKTLPFYDKFPLTIIVGPAKDGFYGLNLHYLPPVLRAKLLDALLGITNNNKFNDTTKFKLSYDMLRTVGAMKYYKPCLKHYLNDHVSSHFARVSAPDFEIAVFLPTASWSIVLISSNL